MPRRREGNRQEGAVRDDVQDDGDDTGNGAYKRYWLVMSQGGGPPRST